MASVPICERPFLAFDLETTGVDIRYDEPVSYALVTRGTSEDGAIYRITAPHVESKPEALAVHGITEERIALEGVHIKHAMREIGNTLIKASREGTVLVGMNVSFDLTITDRLLRRECGKGLLEAGWRGPIVDLLVLDHYVDKYRKGKRTLTALCEHYGVPFENAHDALADASVCIDVAKKILEGCPKIRDLDPIELLRFQDKQYRQRAREYNDYRLSKGQEAIELYKTWPILIDVPSWDEVLEPQSQSVAPRVGV